MKEQLPERDEDRVRELLARVVPDTPGGPDRADEIVRRGRTRRRRTLAAAAVATAAAAVIAVPPAVLESSPATNESSPTAPSGSGPAPSPGEPPRATPAVNPCPTPVQDVETAGQTLPDADGLVSVRLCKLADDTAGPGWYDVTFWRPPADALVLDLAGFIAQLEALPDADPHRCDAVRPANDPHALYLTYADGRVVAIGSGFVGCTDLVVAGRHVDMSAAFDTYSTWLAAQRAQLDPGPATPPALAECAEGRAFIRAAYAPTRAPGDGFPVVAAIACFTPDPLGPDARAESGVFTQRQLDVLLGDLAENSTTEPSREGMCIDTGPSTAILAVNAWGDLVPIVDNNCTGEYAFGLPEDAARYWVPDGESRSIIQSVLG
jgi:hypothetical protein